MVRMDEVGVEVRREREWEEEDEGVVWILKGLKRKRICGFYRKTALAASRPTGRILLDLPVRKFSQTFFSFLWNLASWSACRVGRADIARPTLVEKFLPLFHFLRGLWKFTHRLGRAVWPRLTRVIPCKGCSWIRRSVTPLHTCLQWCSNIWKILTLEVIIK